MFIVECRRGITIVGDICTSSELVCNNYVDTHNYTSVTYIDARSIDFVLVFPQAYLDTDIFIELSYCLKIDNYVPVNLKL